jgi:hypothetical protein
MPLRGPPLNRSVRRPRQESRCAWAHSSRDFAGSSRAPVATSPTATYVAPTSPVRISTPRTSRVPTSRAQTFDMPTCAAAISLRPTCPTPLSNAPTCLRRIFEVLACAAPTFGARASGAPPSGEHGLPRRHGGPKTSRFQVRCTQSQPPNTPLHLPARGLQLAPAPSSRNVWEPGRTAAGERRSERTAAQP